MQVSQQMLSASWRHLSWGSRGTHGGDQVCRLAHSSWWSPSHQTVKEKAKVPVIETGVGNCHIYVDKYADLDMATQIVINAKTQRPSVCNAAESLVVHADIAEDFLPHLEKSYSKSSGCWVPCGWNGFETYGKKLYQLLQKILRQSFLTISCLLK